MNSRFRAESVGSRVSTVPIEMLQIPRSGKAYDLSSGWWPGMPMLPAHPPFQMVTFRTPSGTRNEAEPSIQSNRENLGFISELMMCTSHSGTHIDALAHCTCGPNNAWHGGFSADAYLGDFGPMNKDASELPPMFRRGIMIDVPKSLGIAHLGPGQPVHRADLQAALGLQGTEVKAGDVVLIRTGTMMHWPDAERMADCAGSGLSLDGAEWLLDQQASAVGGDTVALEVLPSGIEGITLPVHRLLIQQNGIPIMEWVYLEDLARDGVYEFLFICLPLPVKGATGSMVRPIALV